MESQRNMNTYTRKKNRYMYAHNRETGNETLQQSRISQIQASCYIHTRALSREHPQVHTLQWASSYSQRVANMG